MDNTNTEIRNRRYAELLRLRSNGIYFSNEKMRERAPSLFDMMVGKYLDDNEKFHLRPTLDVGSFNGKEKSYLTNLLEQFDQTQRISDRRVLELDESSSSKDFSDRFLNHVEHRTTEADIIEKEEEIFEMEFDTSDDEGREAERQRQRSERVRRRRNFGVLANELPLMRKQRIRQNGELSIDNSPKQRFSSLQISKPKSIPNEECVNNSDKKVVGEEWSSGDEDENLVTGISKKQLCDEFVSIMEQRFLSGQDAAFFDYSKLDEAWSEKNATLNRIKEQDLEDAYFAED